MQMTVYYNDADRYLVDLIEQAAQRYRMSRSAVVFSIIEQHFERHNRIGEVLVDMGSLSAADVNAILQRQSETGQGQLFGELAVEAGLIDPHELDQALAVQQRASLEKAL